MTFFWSNTTDSDGHNVNYIGREGQSAMVNGETYTSEQFYDFCLTSSGPTYPNKPHLPKPYTLPSGDIFKGQSVSDTPNYVHHFKETGMHYFYCGKDAHCLKGGVKATINVVGEHDDVKGCHFHPYC